ncbi:MAG: glycosyltransferase family 2 protein [Clostridiales bacterium]|nr:glycosyltransferase family 2 protein [Clostridiales bacterium]
MNYKISVVIRTYNEQKHIGEVLESLKKQTYKNYEILIVDSGSTDRTLEIASKYNVKVVHIKKSDFNYSYASNVGVQNVSGELVSFLSGHSVPVKESFLSDINNVFQDERVGGCYGDVVALPDGSWIEKLYNRLGYIKNKILCDKSGIQLEYAIHPGILSCNNACIRRDLLIRHPFAIELGRGGEDVGVAYRIIQDGYYIARVPELLVMHSHGSGLKKFIQEHKAWKSMWQDIQNYIKE